jgi:hypothetical protein
MANILKDMTGRRFGRLVVTGRGPDDKREARWHVRCDCGNLALERGSRLRSGRRISCGCLGKENHLAAIVTHGQTNTRLYHIWHNIKRRALNPSDKDWPRYGGRGIGVCDRWRDSFEAFAADMGQPPSDAHSIERINNEDGYQPANCKWATRHEQGRNKRNNRIVEYRGRSMPLSEACEQGGAGISWHTARNRMKHGWSVERAVETKSRKA